jgi:hypothetical protein
MADATTRMDCRRSDAAALPAACALAALLAGASLPATPALATGPSGVTGEGDDGADAPAWLLHLSGDKGAQGTQGFGGELEVAPQGSAPSFGVTALRAESEPPELAGSGLATTTRTTAWSLAAGYDFGPVSARVGYEDARDTGLRQSGTVSGSVNLPLGAFDLGLLVQRRTTDFDPFAVTTPVTLRSGQVVNVNGLVRCDVDDLGYGLTLGWHGETSSIYLTGTHYDNADIGCSYAASVPAELNRVTRRVFTALAGRRSALFKPRAGGVIGQQAQLLDLAVGAGVARDIGRVNVAIDLMHSRDAITAAAQDGASLTLSWPVDAPWAIELTGGGTSTDGESVAYGGLGIRARL